MSSWSLITFIGSSRKSTLIAEEKLAIRIGLRSGNCILNSSQVKYRLLHGRLEILGRPQLTQPQLRPITWRGIIIWKKKRLKWKS